jgi:hypothetical protein
MKKKKKRRRRRRRRGGGGGGGGGFEGDDDDEEEESQELAANLVKMAIERTIPKSGEEEVAGAGEGGEAKEE